MTRNTIALALVSVLAAAPVAAAQTDNTAIIFGGWSEHFADDSTWCMNGECHDDYNETNNAIGFEYNNWSIVKMDNSYDVEGVAAYYTFEPEWASFKYVDFGFRAGLVYGYENTPVGKPMWNLPVVPLLSPVAEIKPFVGIEYAENVHAEIAAMYDGDDTLIGMLNLKYVF